MDCSIATATGCSLLLTVHQARVTDVIESCCYPRDSFPSSSFKVRLSVIDLAFLHQILQASAEAAMQSRTAVTSIFCILALSHVPDRLLSPIVGPELLILTNIGRLEDKNHIRRGEVEREHLFGCTKVAVPAACASRIPRRRNNWALPLATQVEPDSGPQAVRLHTVVQKVNSPAGAALLIPIMWKKQCAMSNVCLALFVSLCLKRSPNPRVPNLGDVGYSGHSAVGCEANLVPKLS